MKLTQATMVIVAMTMNASAYQWSDGGSGPHYRFGSSDSVLATGSVEVPPEQTADSVTTYLEPQASMTFVGGPLNLQNAGELKTTPNSTMVLETDVNASEGISFENAAVRTSETFSDVFPQYEAKILKRNASLSEWRVISAHMKGGDAIDVDVYPYNCVAKDGHLDVQLQDLSEGVLKCLKIRLQQNGPDIEIVYVYSRFINATQSKAGLGVNFDAIPLAANNVADSNRGEYYACDYDLACQRNQAPADATENGFGLTSLTLEKTGGVAVFSAEAAVDVSGELAVSNSAEVVIHDENALGGESIEAAIRADGKITFLGTTLTKVISSTISGDPYSSLALGSGRAHGDVTSASMGVTKPKSVIENAYLMALRGFSDVDISGSTAADVFFIKNDGNTATMQFQGFFARQYTACCYITMIQVGDNVQAEMTKAVYKTDKVDTVEQSQYFGVDFDTITPTGNWSYNVTSANFEMDSMLTAEVGEVHPRTTVNNVNLSQIKGFTGVDVSGSNRGGVFFYKRVGDSATAQIQGRFNNYTASCYVTLTQNGGAVDVVMTKALYVYDTEAPGGVSYFGKDFDELGTVHTWNYYPTRVLMVLNPMGKFALACESQVAGGRIEVSSNVVASVMTENALPPNGTIEVGPFAKLTLSKANAGQGNRAFVIRKNGVLTHNKASVFDPFRSYFVIDGGTVAFSPVKIETTEYQDYCGAYVNFFTFADGGDVTGLKPMMLGYADGYISVRGASPAAWNSGALLVGNRNLDKKYHLYLDVDDVTGDAEHDFVLGGELRELGSAVTYTPKNRAVIHKRGEGTLRVDVASPYLLSVIRVEKGVLLLNAVDAFPVSGREDGDGGGICLCGGTLAIAAGKNNDIQALSLDGASKITVGDGATLSIGDSSACRWADNATLDVEIEGTAKVRFAGLLSAQKRSLRLDGKRATLDKDGYVVPVGGMVLVVR